MRISLTQMDSSLFFLSFNLILPFVYFPGMRNMKICSDGTYFVIKLKVVV